MSIWLILLCVLGYFVVGFFVLATYFAINEDSYEDHDVQDLAMFVVLWPFIPIAYIAYYIVTGFGSVVKWLLKKLTK